MYVWSKTASVVRWNDGIVRLSLDQVWLADDPFVKAHPDLFTAAPPLASTTTNPRGVVVRPVESATRAPGEKRGRVRG